MVRADDVDLREHLVFTRVGWCRLYNETSGDEPIRGGDFNLDDVGSEFANYSVIGGRVYGYARIGYDGRFNLLRTTGSSQGINAVLTVALFATPPGAGGQVLVGWYRRAKVSDRVYPTRPEGAYGVYNWECAASDAVLLPNGYRRVAIPKGKGGSGQSNVAYARDNEGHLRKDSWIDAARRFIGSYDGPNLVGLGDRESSEAIMEGETEALLRGQNILQSAEMRVAIENHAMRKTKAALLADGYDLIEDVHKWESFDFHCRKKGVWRKIEVKGTRTPGEALLFSDAEVRLAESARVDLYVVSGIELTEREDSTWAASGGKVASFADWGRKKFQRKSVGWLVTL